MQIKQKSTFNKINITPKNLIKYLGYRYNFFPYNIKKYNIIFYYELSREKKLNDEKIIRKLCRKKNLVFNVSSQKYRRFRKIEKKKNLLTKKLFWIN